VFFFCNLQADILGSSLFSIVHPEDREMLRRQLQLTPNDLLVEDVEDKGGQLRNV
jgi:hypothetical protein